MTWSRSTEGLEEISGTWPTLPGSEPSSLDPLPFPWSAAYCVPWVTPVCAQAGLWSALRSCPGNKARPGSSAPWLYVPWAPPLPAAPRLLS